jgi:ATP-dependent DNA helicase RecG
MALVWTSWGRPARLRASIYKFSGARRQRNLTLQPIESHCWLGRLLLSYISPMRPALLDPLFAPAATLPGVGPKIAKLIDRLLDRPAGARVVDLLFHLPYATLDRRARPKIRDAAWDAIATLEVRVAEHRPPPNARSKAPFKVLVEDETGDVELVFFLANHDWIRKQLPLGETRWVSGKLEMWDGHLQMVHPDRVMDSEALAKMPAIEPVYGLTEGLFPRVLAKAVQGALTRAPRLPEWIADANAQRLRAPGFAAALGAMHVPQQPGDIDPTGPAWTRLAYDELLANQLALLMVRARMRSLAGRANASDGHIATKIEAALPFRLTGAQTKALAEIRADLAAPKRMLRLLQGDVGSGKTVVALLAMAAIVEAGRQAALMAPTEILARQHFDRMRPLAEAAGLRIALLTGRDKAAERNRTLAALAAGEIDLAVGTHALFQESVAFADLGLAVVDEQHRFGVHQRLALASKGEAVDLLVMTATPIPRTLVLTYFGDMDVSALTEKPPGRTPIDTRALPLERLSDVVAAIGRAIASGARAYWVCPLVEESEELDVAAAQERAEALRAIFGSAVDVIHGRMKGPDKDAAMERFQRGETKVLVATTVIEVGVDVAEATIMVIEHAERFGLAQLHQLRGRVGRGAGRSTCLLLYKAPLGEVARARLEILRETEDGFRIAEEDLRLRGEGEVLGSRQAGAPGFRLARLELHGQLLSLARDEAQAALARAPRLAGEENRALRVLLYLFERDEAVRLLEAG